MAFLPSIASVVIALAFVSANARANTYSSSIYGVPRADDEVSLPLLAPLSLDVGDTPPLRGVRPLRENRLVVATTPPLKGFFDANGYVDSRGFAGVTFNVLANLQVEHVYQMQLAPSVLSDRVYLGGFLDQNLWIGGPSGGSTSTIVTEHQIGLRLVDKFYAVAELRRNEFLTSRKNGVGVGVEYLIPFERSR